MLKKEMEKRIEELEVNARAKDEEIRLLKYDRHSAKKFAAKVKVNNSTIAIIAITTFIETNFPMIEKNGKDEWDNVVIVETVENPTDRNYLMMKYLLKLLND